MSKYAKSEIDAQRELLDSLMGVNRNRDMKNDIKDYRDDRVCKFFLTGMCPHDIFVNTKMDEGPCPKIHSEQLKEEFKRSKDVYCYDSLLMKEFSFRLQEADRVIKRARQRVEDDKLDEELNPDLNPDIIKIHDEVSKVIAEAEAAAAADDIDKAQDLVLNRLEELYKDKNGIISRLNEIRKQRQGGAEKKLRVCDVCGSFLSIADSDKRLSDHFLGKQHIGFQYMRDCITEIQKRRDEKKNAPSDDTRRRDEREPNNTSRRDDSRDRKRRRDSRSRDRSSRDRRDDYRRRDRDRDNRYGKRDDSRGRGRY